MPYIKESERWEVDARLRSAMDMVRPVGEPVGNVGLLNYCITKLIRAFLGSPLSYARLNAAIGVLECAKLELYRRLAAPYEDRKCAENGDVYDV